MYYLFLCRSLTYAQRSSRLLERKGIGAFVVKAPAQAAANGCAYAVRIAPHHRDAALLLLRDHGLTPKRVFMHENGELREILS